jgi:predicted AlkP superfamily pyrophosphatase or phosphodiesterase
MPYDYDQRVPVILYGAGIKPGRYNLPASPADIAPTLAVIAHINIAATDGRVLTEILASAPSR